MNPGAIGNYGIHQVKTILCFTIDGKEITTIDKAELALVPNSTVSLDKSQSSQTLKLLDELEDLDDVQKVFTNANFDDESIEMYSKTS